MSLPAHGTASPANIHVGGRDVSVSYLRDWVACRRLWYWRHAYVWESGDRGAEPRHTSIPLLIGSAFHAGVAAWRAAGWQDGKYDADAALRATRDHLDARRDEFTDEDAWASAAAESVDLVQRYCAKWAGEHPDVTVLGDDAGPFIERLFEVPIGEDGYVLNVRPDAVVRAHGFLAVNELKTAAPSRAGATFAAMERSPQTLAELYVLRTLGNDIAGVYVDVAVKGNTRTVEKFQRRLVTCDDALVAGFPEVVADLLAEMREAAVPAFLPLAEQLRLHPMTGMFHSECDRCAFAPLCWNPGTEQATLTAYRPRTAATTEETPE